MQDDLSQYALTRQIHCTTKSWISSKVDVLQPNNFNNTTSLLKAYWYSCKTDIYKNVVNKKSQKK